MQFNDRVKSLFFLVRCIENLPQLKPFSMIAAHLFSLENTCRTLPSFSITLSDSTATLLVIAAWENLKHWKGLTEFIKMATNLVYADISKICSSCCKRCNNKNISINPLSNYIWWSLTLERWKSILEFASSWQYLYSSLILTISGRWFF